LSFENRLDCLRFSRLQGRVVVSRIETILVDNTAVVRFSAKTCFGHAGSPATSPTPGASGPSGTDLANTTFSYDACLAEQTLSAGNFRGLDAPGCLAGKFRQKTQRSPKQILSESAAGLSTNAKGEARSLPSHSDCYGILLAQRTGHTSAKRWRRRRLNTRRKVLNHAGTV